VKALEILTSKISRKAVLIAMAMVLVYLISVAPTATFALISIAVICSLALFGTGLQFYLDWKKLKNDSTGK